MKNLTKNLLYALLVGLAVCSVPLGAKERPRPTESAERSRPSDTPYSNRSVRRDREARRQVEEAERAKRPDYYQFKRRDN